MNTAFIKAFLLSLFLPLIFGGKSPCYRAVLLFSCIVSFSFFFSIFILSVWIDCNLLTASFFFADEVQFFFLRNSREAHVPTAAAMRFETSEFFFPFHSCGSYAIFFIVCLRSSLYLFFSTFYFSMSTAVTRRK